MTDLFRWSATAIAKAVKARRVSVEDVTRAHIDRIDAVNPAINAVVQDTRDEALAAARALDGRMAQGEELGPMAGVPVTIKVNVDQKGWASTNGLRLSANNIAEHDNPVVSNLRKAGAMIVGRTNTPAFSVRWFTKNELHGQTLNPRNKDITPGGSSGGAAAAVAAGLCAMGHGTDIAGSVRYPAYACGVQGLRPTLGRIPAYNASAVDRFIGAQVMAVSGPMARTIDDLELSLWAMAARDLRDPYWSPAPQNSGPFPKRAALCVAPDGMTVEPAVREALNKAARILEDAGWDVDEVACPPMREAARINTVLWMAETKYYNADTLEREGEAESQFVVDVMRRDLGPIDLDMVMNALQSRATLIRDWELFLESYPVLLCPNSGELPFDQQLDVKSEADFLRVYEAQLPQRGLPVMGMPGLSVAMGSAEGRPVGVQLVAGRFREDVLFDAGRVIEAAGPLPDVADPM